MKALRNYLDKIKPNFEEGGKYHAFRSVFEGFETFLFVPNTTSKSGTHIHDAIDSKRIMSFAMSGTSRTSVIHSKQPTISSGRVTTSGTDKLFLWQP